MNAEKFWREIRSWVRTALGLVVLVWPPIIAVGLLPIWPRDFSALALVGFFALSLLAFVAWDFGLHASGFLRWLLYRTWRPGMKPCMCDLPTYCFKHSSGRNEPNRPGLVEARLRGDS
jgi:hypothetical protein